MAKGLEYRVIGAGRVIVPTPVCTENLNTGVVVMKSAQDGA